MAKMNSIYINGNKVNVDGVSIGPDGLMVTMPHYFAQDSFDRGAVNCCSIGGDYIKASTFPQASVDNLSFDFYPVKKYKSGIRHLCRNELAAVFGAGAY